MKKFFAIVLLASAAATFITAQDIRGGGGASEKQPIDYFNENVAFEYTLKEIDEMLTRGRFGDFDPASILILDGAIASISILNPDAENFQAEIELVNGEWTGLDDVEMYRSFILVQGEQFAARIPARRTRTLPPNVIQTNDRVIIIAQLIDTLQDTSGKTLPYFYGYAVRVLP